MFTYFGGFFMKLRTLMYLSGLLLAAATSQTVVAMERYSDDDIEMTREEDTPTQAIGANQAQALSTTELLTIAAHMSERLEQLKQAGFSDEEAHIVAGKEFPVLYTSPQATRRNKGVPGAPDRSRVREFGTHNVSRQLTF